MKKVLLVLASAVFVCSIHAQERNLQSLVGKWEAVAAYNAGGGLEVIDSTKMFIVYGEKKKAIVHYSVDFTKSPVWFNFTIKDSTETLNLKSILHFINDDLIKWQVFDDEAQYVYFASNTGSDMVYLRRKK
jgi:hypothetical protein